MNGSALRVLLVDDEPLARVRLRTLLADMVDPPAEICGETATPFRQWNCWKAPDYDLLLDIHMPGMDGMQLAQRIRGSGGSDCFCHRFQRVCPTRHLMDLCRYRPSSITVRRLANAFPELFWRCCPARRLTW